MLRGLHDDHSRTTRNVDNVYTCSIDRALDNEDYQFTGTKFLGLTNGGEFCYKCTFPVKGGTDSTKVFLKFDPTVGRVIATVG
jgi:hypothetical protein